MRKIFYILTFEKNIFKIFEILFLKCFGRLKTWFECLTKIKFPKVFLIAKDSNALNTVVKLYGKCKKYILCKVRKFKAKALSVFGLIAKKHLEEKFKETQRMFRKNYV